MSPQFVDFDADGHLDIVAGTFDGSPHLARGSAGGFLKPSHILDAAGERILINQFWNLDARKWDETHRCDPEGFELANGHCTSAFAHDWDGDGDFDLLLGDYDGGHVYLRRNEGKPGAPAFTGVNVPVLAGGKPLAVGKTSTPRMLDVDGDGLHDLLVGSFGDSYGDEPGGTVHLYRNRGTATEPRFDSPEVLVDASRKGWRAPTRPDAGLYPDLADFDDDGDLDLVVGAYSLWTPEQRTLTDDEQARVAELRAELKQVQAEQTAILKPVTDATKGLDAAAAATKRAELLAAAQPDLTALGKRRQTLQKEMDALVPARQRVSYVWLYENTGKPSK